MTKEDKRLLLRMKVGVVILRGSGLIDNETFKDLMRFEKLPEARQEELIKVIRGLDASHASNDDAK